MLGVVSEGIAPIRVPLRTAVEFGEFIRAARKRAGITQADLAYRLGVSRKWVSEVERGKPTVEFGMVLTALRFLGFTLQATTSPAPAIVVDDLLDALTEGGQA